ncbi:MAG TPA: copper resistance protein CopC [Candidatus Limnocylindrales bacterium]
MASRSLRRFVLVGLSFAALSGAATVAAGPALGHALLQRSSPAAGATIGTAPAVVTLTFGEPPDPRLSSVKVLDTAGASVAGGPATIDPADRNTLDVPLKGLPDGVYTVSWRTVSAVDGHVAAGSFAFGIGVAPPASGPSSSPGQPTASPAAILARFLLFAGLIALLGAAYVGFFVGSSLAAGAAILDGLATIAWLVAAIGTAFTVAVSWDEAGIDGSTVLVTSLGIIGLVRLVAVGLTAVPVLLLRRGAGPRHRRLLGLAGLGAIVAMTVDVAAGHAASDASGPIGLAAQWAHVVAAGLWMGGLLALLLTVRGDPSSEKAAAVRRFSTWAAPWIGLVAITGVVRAIQEVGSIPALFQDGYGQLVIVKTVLLLVLAVLGATNRWWSVPAAGRSLGRLRRIGTAELGVATVVFAVAAALVNGVPPVSIGAAAAAGPQPIVATGADSGTSVKVRLAITPGGAGSNAFDVVVTDYDTGTAVPAAAVALRFSLASRTGVGESTLDLQPGDSPGSFSASGSNLSVDGIWKVTATIGQGSTAAEVPFVVATTIDAQPTDVLPGQGTPTLYDVHLPDGTSAQLYLDPGTPGSNELHITYFDAAGTERPITTATMALTSGAGQLLSPRLLEPGHFVADVTLDAGPLAVDVVGIDSGGSQIHVHATLEVTP